MSAASQRNEVFVRRMLPRAFDSISGRTGLRSELGCQSHAEIGEGLMRTSIVDVSGDIFHIPAIRKSGLAVSQPSHRVSEPSHCVSPCLKISGPSDGLPRLRREYKGMTSKEISREGRKSSCSPGSQKRQNCLTASHRVSKTVALARLRRESRGEKVESREERRARMFDTLAPQAPATNERLHPWDGSRGTQVVFHVHSTAMMSP